MLRYQNWKVAAILIGTFIAFLLVLPSVLPQNVSTGVSRLLPSFVPFRPIVLGLDLQGGAHILLEVDTADLIHKEVDALRDDVRRVLREQKIPITGGIGASDRGVQVRIADPAERQKALAALQSLSQPIGNLFSGAAGRTVNISQTPEGLVQLTITDAGLNDRVRRAVDQSIEVIRRRVDQLGTREPNIQREGSDRIVVEVPGLQDTTKLKEILGTTAKLEFRLVADPGEPPSEVETLPMMEGTKQAGTINVERRVMVQGEDLTDAQAGFDQRTGEPVVNFRFNIRGGQRFGEVTSHNVNKLFAIVLDGKVISAPRILTPILGGQGQISGRFTVEQANDLAVLLRSGALPAKLTVAEERTVGPGLGQDSINAGKNAVLVAGVFVILFMVVTYGLFGIFANIALFIHVVLIFALMAIFGATLTLPGIAGVVLTIGTAVDSNVLIYERIREEFKAGRSMISAIDAGFNRAFATIFDSNSTMALAAIILFLMGSGPVRGFAVVFLFGIFTTVITAVTMTRMMIARWYQARRPKALPF